MSELKQFYYKKNRLQQLKGFYYTAQLGSVTKASKKMGLTQSTVTLQIQSLERDLGTSIFQRDSGSLKLTKDGELLYTMAAYHIQSIDSIYEDFLKKKENLEPLQINIATHHIAISYLLPKYIKKFSKLYPDITIGIKNISPDQALQRVLDEEIDLMIYPNIKPSDEFDSSIFRSFDPLLIMRNTHPLAKKDEIELKDISNYNTVRIDEGLISLPVFEAVFKEFNFKTNIKFENANWEIIKNYVKNDIGLGFVSTICVNQSDTDLASFKLNKYFPTMDYSITTKKGKIFSNAVSDFIDIIRQFERD